MSNLSISELCIYPIKSCRGIQQKSAIVEAFGLSGDRRWMLVDSTGVMLTQRKIASMCLIHPILGDNTLILRHSAMKDLSVNIPVANNKVRVKVWEDYCDAYDAGDNAAIWLTQVLMTECRLVYFPSDGFRQVDLNYANEGDKIAFSDGFPLLFISQASLDDLNTRLDKPISMSRFRPNIVVQGCDAFAEDGWKRIRIGDNNFRVVKPCSRCVIPSINLETAEREPEPIKTLLAYRKRDNKIFFGQNVIAENNGLIEVGMQVEVIE